MKTDTIIPGLEIPNLDALTDEDLDNACDAFELLERLSYSIRRARNLRATGYGQTALKADAESDRLYSQLPQSLRY